MKMCADDARVACPLFREEYGGSIPTSALQLHIGRITSKLAAILNKQWHSRLPEITNWQTCESYAAECGNVFYAVAMWSSPVNRTLCQQHCFELRRMAVAPDAPPNTPSRMLAIMRRMIVADHPDVERLISYQDTSVHKGTIYKAAGWTCIGKTHQGGKCGWDNNVRHRAESNGKEVLHAIKHRWELKIR